MSRKSRFFDFEKHEIKNLYVQALSDSKNYKSRKAKKDFKIHVYKDLLQRFYKERKNSDLDIKKIIKSLFD